MLSISTLAMQFQKTELLNRLSEYGWRLAGNEENLEWWVDEMWLLESVWSPAGCRAYLTFLVDPQFEGNRKKGEAVWAVMASMHRPVSSHKGEHEFLLSLGHGWRNDLPLFFDQMNKLRRSGN